ncbi:MAG TPA: polyribonucleotide nucleotidyltransferase [Dehalococcoidia bacterium]|nr:polyribonucleotide nucleotidyltransferase [Dehalococcoidia bacterium]
MVHQLETEIGGKTLRLETGKLAKQAGGSLTLTYGETVVLAAATGTDSPREGTDFFPLTVEVEERYYAAGKIPGGWFRREARPSTDAILTDRLTDRPLRPLFPKGYRNEVQIVCTILSADQENDYDVFAINGASAAVALSDIPWDGPIGACRVGYTPEGEYLINPTFEQRETSLLDLVVASTSDAVAMVEAGAKEVSEEIVLEAIKKGHEVNQKIIEKIDELVKLAGKPKMAFTPAETPADLVSTVSSFVDEKLSKTLEGAEKHEREDALADFRKELLEAHGESYDKGVLLSTFESEVKKRVRTNIIDRNIRPDGRQREEIRPITCEVGILPRPHGTGLFTRGQTQVLSVLTLGTVGDAQRLDTIGPAESKRFLHHYNFPPFSVGEVRRMGGPGRRDIGHGALAERALDPVIPSVDEFPYTLRLVSETLESNGSSSMASVCGSTLALMDAGVPIKAPVAGVAMGLITGENGAYAVLTDIAGIEDAMGDMDFKVAGTAEGVTAVQLDIKIVGLSFEIMEQALKQAKDGRLFILGKMAETITEPRTEMSAHAPRMYRINIPQEKIGAVIGPGGKMIRSITEETKASIDIEDDGTVFVGATNEESARRAIEIIEGMTKEAEIGAIYNARVTRLMNFGVFVEYLPNKEGMIHISELADYRVPTVEDVVQVGDEVMAMVTEVDSMGRVNLSRRAVLEGATEAPRTVGGRRPGEGGDDRQPRERRDGGGGGGRGRGGRDRDRNRDRGNGGGGYRGGRGGGGGGGNYRGGRSGGGGTGNTRFGPRSSPRGDQEQQGPPAPPPPARPPYGNAW